MEIDCPQCDGGREMIQGNCETCHGDGVIEDSTIDDWLEEQILFRFPDNLNIPVRQLRVRIGKLCFEYKQKLLDQEPILSLEEEEAAEKSREFLSDPCWQEPMKNKKTNFCRYDDCPAGNPTDEEQVVTCPLCRDYMGLPPLTEA